MFRLDDAAPSRSQRVSRASTSMASRCSKWKMSDKFFMQGFTAQAAPSRCGCEAEAVLPGIDPVQRTGEAVGQLERGFHLPNFGIQGRTILFEICQSGQGGLLLRLIVALRELGAAGIGSAASAQGDESPERAARHLTFAAPDGLEHRPELAGRGQPYFSVSAS